MMNVRMCFPVSACLCVIGLLLQSAAFGVEKPEINPEALKAYQTGVYAQYVDPGKANVPNQQLVDIMWEITEQQFKDTPADEKGLPAGTSEEDVLKRLKQRIPGFPCVQVTAEDDVKFKAGKFDDVNNFIAYMDFMKILNDNKVPIPYALQSLQRDQKKGGLKGARLELGVRFAFMIISKVYRSAEKK